MDRRKIVVLAASLLVSVPGVAVLGPSPAVAHFNGCTTKANDPHVSRTSAGESNGIVAKSTIQCGHQHDSASLAIQVWKCSEGFGDGKPSKTWIENHCNLKFGRVADIEPLKAKKYVRQAPKKGGTKYKLRGWFVQDTAFFMFNNGNVYLRQRVSHVVRLDGR